MGYKGAIDYVFGRHVREDIKRLKTFILTKGGGNSFQIDSFLEEELDESEVKILLKRGVFMDGLGARILSMEKSDCHENSKRLVRKNPRFKPYTGLALSNDGIWRVHSWVLDSKGKVIETTVPRIRYFGVHQKR